MLLRRGGIPYRRSRGIAVGDLDPVQIGDKPIVVLHLELQRVELRGILHGKRQPQVGRRITVIHAVLQVGLDQRRVIVGRRAERSGELPAVPPIVQQREVGRVEVLLANRPRQLQRIGPTALEIIKLNRRHQRLAYHREGTGCVSEIAGSSVRQCLINIGLALRQRNAGEFLPRFA